MVKTRSSRRLKALEMACSRKIQDVAERKDVDCGINKHKNKLK